MLHDLDSLWKEPNVWQPSTLQKYGFQQNMITVFPYETLETKSRQQAMHNCLESTLILPLRNFIAEYVQDCFVVEENNAITNAILSKMDKILHRFQYTDKGISMIKSQIRNMGLFSYIDCIIQETFAARQMTIIFLMVKHYQMNGLIYLLGAIQRMNAKSARQYVDSELCQLQLRKCNPFQCYVCFYNVEFGVKC